MNPVLWYTKRALQAIATFFVVMNIAFVVIRFMPGGPMDYVRAQLLQQGIASDRIDRLTEVYANVNPDLPFWEQYVGYMSSIATGDLGQSLWHQEPVISVLADALPWTIFIMGSSILLMYVFGILIGAFLAYKEGSRLDQVWSILLTMADSVPFYIVALVLLFALGFQLDLFPTRGRFPRGTEPGFTVSFLLGVVHHAVLPVASVVLTRTGLLALQMRGNSISVLGRDFVRVAELRGLPDRVITTQYVARNAVLPMYTSFLISIGFMFSGSVILEVIFNYPGVGYYLIQAVDTRDQPLMMGTFLMISAAVIVALIVADITYGYIDPRVKRGETDDSF